MLLNKHHNFFGKTAASVIFFVTLLGCAATSLPEKLEKIKTAQIWVTSGDQKKLLTREADSTFNSDEVRPITINVNSNVRYQEMVGFGAAITDASAWLIQTKMNQLQRANLLQDLFGRSPGIGFSFTRLTIGASDFSRTHYSLDDVPAGLTDPDLNHFSITPNRLDVLPVVKSAIAINPNLLVMATPWSAPAWMKSGDSLIQGSLKPESYAYFAQYLQHYIEAYRAEGVPIFAITLQNEPHFEPTDYPGMRFNPTDRATFIAKYLGPLFHENNINTRILDWDHNWDEPISPLTVLTDPHAAKYINGVAWHCYAGNVNAQLIVRDAHPDKDTYFTECSGGEWAPVWSDNLQYFTRTLIIGSTRAWAKGVLMWNLALDENHGPHLGGCGNCRGIVTIDSKTGEVTRNVEYYALAHASRFVHQGAQRIESNSEEGLENVAFHNNDDDSLVLIVANSTEETKKFSIRERGLQFQTTLGPKSVATYVWK